MQNAYAFKSYFLQCEGDNLSVAKPGFPPRAPPIWADAFYIANKKKLQNCLNHKLKVINSVSVYEGNGGVARKGWGAGEGTTGFATLSGPFPAGATKFDLQANIK